MQGPESNIARSQNVFLKSLNYQETYVALREEELHRCVQKSCFVEDSSKKNAHFLFYFVLV